MKKTLLTLSIILSIIIFRFNSSFAEAKYVYHEQSISNPGCGSDNYVSNLNPGANQAVTITFKVENQGFTNQVRVYYTTDGSTPAAAFGTPSGTTQVITATYSCTFVFSGSTIDVAKATIPGQSAGITVKYIVSGWHSGGGDEIFANGPGSPCGCGAPTNSSSLATVYSYSSIVLGAELTSFDAQKSNQAIALSWLTASEQNNNYFNIERSSNGKSFTTIGQVKGSGTTASSNKYNFIDNNPLSGVNYYRLNAVETSGKTAFSKIVTVDFSSKGSNKLVAYPNPTKSALNVNYESIDDASLNIQVLDMTGKVHLTKQMEGLKGDNNIRLDIDNLPNGAYFMRINDSSTKFFKM